MPGGPAAPERAPWRTAPSQRSRRESHPPASLVGGWRVGRHVRRSAHLGHGPRLGDRVQEAADPRAGCRALSPVPRPDVR
eukprot:8365479-Pyramimonas_sp.AAC.1